MKPIHFYTSLEHIYNSKHIIVEVEEYKRVYVAHLVDISKFTIILHTLCFVKSPEHTIQYIQAYMFSLISRNPKIHSYIYGL